MSWFTENSMFPLVTGVLMVVILTGMAIASRENKLLILAFGIGLLTAGVVAIEQWIVTPKEAVEARVYELANYVAADDVKSVVSFVSDRQPETIARVEAEMPRYDFDSCRVLGTTDFDFTDGSPPKAKISFSVTVRVSIDGTTPVGGLRKVHLWFEQESDGKWRIVDYAHEAPNRGLSL